MPKYPSFNDSEQRNPNWSVYRPFHHMPLAELFRIGLSVRLSYQDVDHDALSVGRFLRGAGNVSGDSFVTSGNTLTNRRTAAPWRRVVRGFEKVAVMVATWTWHGLHSIARCGTFSKDSRRILGDGMTEMGRREAVVLCQRGMRAPVSILHFQSTPPTPFTRCS